MNLAAMGRRLLFAAQMAVHGVLANPLRSGLTMLGVAIGVASVVSLMAIGEGARQTVVDQFKSLGANVIVIRSEDPSISFPGTEADSLRERVPSMAYATPVVETQTVMRWRRARGTADILGVNEQYPEIRDQALVSGQFFSSLHVQQRSAVAVLGYNIGAGLMNGRNPVGQSITLDGRSYRIIGVLAAKGPGKSEGIDDKIVIPYTAAQQIAKKTTVTQIWGKALSEREADLAVAQLGRIFRRKMGMDPGAPTPGGNEGGEPGFDGGLMPMPMHGGMFRGGMAVSRAMPMPGGGGMNTPSGDPSIFGGRDLITITNLNQMVEEADQANRIMTLLLGGIAAVSLLVGGLGIMNIMLVAVSERTAEIGVRRALGATQGDMVSQFLIEALYLSGLGALAGIAAGVWATGLFEQLGLSTAINFQAVQVATFVALGSGLLFGVFPAVSASSLQPAEALRR